MTKLVVIGNGFDIHHGLDTKYISFGFFLKNYYNDIYEKLLNFYGFPNVNDIDEDQLWNEFEKSLSFLNEETVLDHYSDSIANSYSPDFKDRDWGTFAIEIEMFVDELTGCLFKAFKEFILQINYPDLNKIRSIKLAPNDLYISFNYTNTLECYYGVPNKNIFYIHGKAENDSYDLLLGHGIDPEEFRQKEESQPKNLTMEELQLWEDDMANKFNFSFELGKDALFNYFIKSYKATNKIIDDNQLFFNNLDTIKEVWILGHSLSEIDLAYFYEINKSVPKTVNWYVSYYSEKEKLNHCKALDKIGIPVDKYNLIKLNNLQCV